MVNKTSKNELLSHKAAKLMIYHFIDEYGGNMSKKDMEKWVPPLEKSKSGRKGGRRIDVALETKRGQKIAVEVQSSDIRY